MIFDFVLGINEQCSRLYTHLIAAVESVVMRLRNVYFSLYVSGCRAIVRILPGLKTLVSLALNFLFGCF